MFGEQGWAVVPGQCWDPKIFGTVPVLKFRGTINPGQKIAGLTPERGCRTIFINKYGGDGVS